MVYTKYKHTLKFFVLISSILITYAQSMQDLNRLKSEYEKFKKDKLTINQPLQINSQSVENTKMRRDIAPYNNARLSSFSDSLNNKNMHFGYDFFNKSDTLSFWENLPVPSSYLIGPGDEIVVSLWGATQLRTEYLVGRDGKIYDEKVGILYISGKTVNQAKSYLSNEFSKVYATLRSNSPSTFLDISLGGLKSINVNFIGELHHPGLYPMHPYSNLITGLIQIGGIDTTGTLRNITIKRKNKITINIDLYDYLINGDIPEDIQLRDQDVVLVPTRMTKVSICSSVVRPGIYEAVKKESVKDLINFAGGLKPNASSIVGISRIIPITERDFNQSPNVNFYIDYNDSKSVNIENGDTITVKSISPTVNMVEIIGQVKKPGPYYFEEGMTVKDLISLSGGFSDTTFWKTVYSKKAEIIRRDPNNPYEKIININLKDLLSNKSKNIFLQNLDRFIVHANPNFSEKRNVQMIGEINIPGSYPIVEVKETLNSLINRSGGLTNKALDDGISIFRNEKYFERGIHVKKRYEFLNDEKMNETGQNEFEEIIKNEYINNLESKRKDGWVRVAWKNKNIPLMPGDSIIVRESTGTVNVSGEVYNPGFIEFQKGKSLKHYLDSAGGPTLNGSTKNIIVVYANGFTIPKKVFNNPKIKDGSTIIINRKEYKEPFKITDFTSSLLSIISTTVTILVLSQQLSNN